MELKVEETRDRIRTVLNGRTVSEIVTHVRHPDEYVAIFLLRKYGQTLFPGVNTTRLVIEPNGNNCTEVFWEELENGRLYLGQGGGPFDEHSHNGQRDSDDSATARVIRVLGVPLNTHLKREFIDAITREDATAQLDGKLNLAYIKKIMARMEELIDDFDVEEWVNTAVKAVWRHEGGRTDFTPKQGGVNMLKRDLFDHFEITADDPGTLHHFVHRVLELFQESTYPLGLSYVGSLISDVFGQNRAYEWTMKGLRAEIQRGFFFQDALQTFRDKRDDSYTVPILRDGHVVCDGEGRPLRIAVIAFHNPEAVRAAYSKAGYDAAVVVKREESGNTQIFLNKSYSNLRTRFELAARVLTECEPEKWSYHFGELLLNGSESHPNVPATALQLKDILWLVHEAIAFDL